MVFFRNFQKFLPPKISRYTVLYNMFSCKTLVELLHSDMNWTTNQVTYPSNCRAKPAQINLWCLYYSKLFNVNFTTVSITLAMAKSNYYRCYFKVVAL